MKASKRALRAFEEADLPALADLWVAAWTETGLPADFAARRAWLRERLRALSAGGAEIVIGLSASGEAGGLVTIDSRTGDLDQLCVAPGERGSGLAVALLNEAKRRSPGFVTLEVNEANTRALRLYEREGFATIGRAFNASSGLPTLKMRWEADG